MGCLSSKENYPPSYDKIPSKIKKGETLALIESFKFCPNLDKCKLMIEIFLENEIKDLTTPKYDVIRSYICANYKEDTEITMENIIFLGGFIDRVVTVNKKSISDEY